MGTCGFLVAKPKLIERGLSSAALNGASPPQLRDRTDESQP